MTKLITGFSNYTISEEGVITNVKTQKIKKPWLGKVGYYYIDLYENNKSTKVALHRLLAQTFLPNPENKRTVNHIDGNKLNNSLANLEWATDSENNQHAYETGLKVPVRLITDIEYAAILEKFFSGISLTEIVKSYNFSLPTFSTYVEEYVNKHNLVDKFNEEKVRQFNLRAINNGVNRRNIITLQMLDMQTNEVINTFTSIAEARKFLDKKSSGPISNVLAGRQNSAYGYYWRKL